MARKFRLLPVVFLVRLSAQTDIPKENPFTGAADLRAASLNPTAHLPEDFTMAEIAANASLSSA